MRNIAYEIKQIRKNLKLSQAEFAKRIGSNRGNIANYETGRARPPLEVWFRIEHLLKKNSDQEGYHAINPAQF